MVMTQDFPAIDSNGDLVRNTCALALTDEEFAWVSRALPELTDRELDVLRAICAGGANEDMADRLCIAVPTLRTHMMRINQKMGATDKADVVRFVASRVVDGYRLSRIPLPSDRIVEVKGTTGNSVGFDAHDPDAKSSLAMMTRHAANGQ